MSYYLHFKKGGVPICNYCRTTALYRAFEDLAPWDNWEPLTKNHLNCGMEEVQERNSWLNSRIEQMEKILEGCVDYEDRADIVGQLYEFKKELHENEKALTMIHMLIDIWNEPEFGTESFESIPMEWGIF